MCWHARLRAMTEPSQAPTAAAWPAAAGVVALLLAMAPRYGFHRDEFYFIVAGRNLDWGFVDQPPLVPLVARMVESLAGAGSPFWFRVLPALAVGGVALFAASIAWRLGAERPAQVYAAFGVGFSGVLLGEGHLLSTAVFDFFFWAMALWILVKLLGGAHPWWWVGLGVVIGVGLENKHTIGLLAVAILVGILATDARRLLASWWPWLGAGVAALLAAPNIVWQAQNGWPQLEMAEALSERSDGPLAFVLFQPLLLSVVMIVPAGIGLWWLLRQGPGVRWRPIGIAFVLLFVFFLVTGGKAYYIAPMYAVLIPAGSIWFGQLGSLGRKLMIGATVLGLFVGLFIALPLLPVSRVAATDATGELGETVGWPELITQIAGVNAGLSDPSAVVFTGSYGEAGAVAVLGEAAGLPPAFSGHNSYWDWGPPPPHGPVIGVGGVGDVMDLICGSAQRVALITNPYGVENEEAGLPIYLCANPTRQLADVWPEVRHIN